MTQPLPKAGLDKTRVRVMARFRPLNVQELST